MDWIQTLSVMATVIASAYYIHREVQQDIRAASQKTNRLYEIFIELLKERGRKKIMEKKELIEALVLLQESSDEEKAHVEADNLLLDYINDKEISAAFINIDKWYA